ncbi:MAG: hypothetical protein WBC44_09960 [Planctomycetaceae bacterium]
MSQETLNAEILALSNAKDWPSAIREWRLQTIWWSDVLDSCLCGTSIKEICVLENRLNGNHAQVGNVCVKRFLGLPSDGLFRSLKKVKRDTVASFNEEMIRFAYERRVINDWEYKFYLNTWRDRTLTEKQHDKKVAINQKILARLIR